jgi:hypothetical protein
MTEAWPWLVLAGLGLYHGLNPAMGWLFAVALGLNRKREDIVFLSLIPIALGHALAVAVVVLALIPLAAVFDRSVLSRAAGVVLILWAAWHLLRGHRQRVRVGMQTGLTGLFAWSFLMASAHGAGLMLIPFVLPLCLSSASASEPATGVGSASLPIALAAVGVHTAAMLATIAAISFVVYRFIGVAFLRRGWINLDLIWVAALLGCGMILLLTSA